MMPGETIATGAPPTCPECKVTVQYSVCMSAAGFYVGTNCDCGPYTRDSGYYKTRRECAAAMLDGSFDRR